MSDPQPTTAYLIERCDPRNTDCVLAGHFFGISGNTGEFKASGHFEWMHSAQYALRFSRKEDAHLFVNWFLNMSERLNHKDTLIGFRTGDYRPIITEHMWS